MREHDLLGLAVGALDVAAQQQVELLVGAAELDVGAHRDRVVALEQRVEQLEHRDRLAAAVALGEVVALEQLGDGGGAREPEELLGAHVEPLAVAAHLDPLGSGSRILTPAPGTSAALASISSPGSTGRAFERPLGSPTRAV